MPEDACNKAELRVERNVTACDCDQRDMESQPTAGPPRRPAILLDR
jgi:hypothetical protein